MNITRTVCPFHKTPNACGRYEMPNNCLGQPFPIQNKDEKMREEEEKKWRP
jgi:hypothetical protein